MDGVLLSTDHLHYKAWKALANRPGIPFGLQQGDRCRGISRIESLEIVLENSTVNYTMEEKESLAQEKNEHYRTSLLSLTPSDIPQESVLVLTELRRRGYKLALASGSRNATLILQKTGLDKLLDGVVEGNDIAHSKPHPEVFLKAVQTLNLIPKECLGVDDAGAGIQAIRTAGMVPVAIGPAAQAEMGDQNLTKLTQLLVLCPKLETETSSDAFSRM